MKLGGNVIPEDIASCAATHIIPAAAAEQEIIIGLSTKTIISRSAAKEIRAPAGLLPVPKTPS